MYGYPAEGQKTATRAYVYIFFGIRVQSLFLSNGGLHMCISEFKEKDLAVQAIWLEPISKENQLADWFDGQETVNQFMDDEFYSKDDQLADWFDGQETVNHFMVDEPYGFPKVERPQSCGFFEDQTLIDTQPSDNLPSLSFLDSDLNLSFLEILQEGSLSLKSDWFFISFFLLYLKWVISSNFINHPVLGVSHSNQRINQSGSATGGNWSLTPSVSGQPTPYGRGSGAGAGGDENDPPFNRNRLPGSHYEEVIQFLDWVLGERAARLTFEQVNWLLNHGPDYGLIVESYDDAQIHADRPWTYYLLSVERRLSGNVQLVVYTRRNNLDSLFSLVTRERMRNNCLGIIRREIPHLGSSVSGSSGGHLPANTNIHLTVSGNQVHASSDAHASPQQNVGQSASTTQNPTLNQTSPQPSNRGRLIPIPSLLVESGLAARAAGFNFPMGNIFHPGRSRLRNAGFQRGRQDFRDGVVSTGLNLRNRFPFVFGSLPERDRFQQNPILPPNVNMRDESQPAFLSGQAEGGEFERRRYQRAHPSLPSGVIPSVVDPQPTDESGGPTGLITLITLIVSTIFANRRSLRTLRRFFGPNRR